MKFNPNNLSILAYANNFTMWHYGAEDLSEAKAAYIEPGFFDEAPEGYLRAGDIIIIQFEEETIMQRITLQNGKRLLTSLLSRF